MSDDESHSFDRDFAAAGPMQIEQGNSTLNHKSRAPENRVWPDWSICFVAPEQQGDRKFRVLEVSPLLKAHPGADDDLLVKIETFIRKDENGKVVYNLTLIGSEPEFVIQGGNKRAVAFRSDTRMQQITLCFRCLL